MRRALTATICLSFLTLIATDAMAKRKSKKTSKAPVSVTLENTCKNALNLTMSGQKVMLKPGAKIPPKTMKPAESGAFEYTLGKKGPQGYIVMAPGGNYRVTFSGCAHNWANIRVTDLAPRPKKISKNAAVQVRFRAALLKGQKKRSTLEYRQGERGRFKRMSAKPSRYVKTTKGDFAYGLRVKGGRRGPVLQTLNAKAPLDAGKKYLIEASVVNKKIFVKVEDEGWEGK